MKIPLNRICYDYRANILFSIYYLMSKDEESMSIMQKIDHGLKYKRRNCFTKKYINKWFEIIRDTPVRSTEFGWSTCEKKGQVLKEVAFIHKKGLYYPGGGFARIPVSYVLGHKYVPGKIIESPKGNLYGKDFSFSSRHFEGMPKKIMTKLLLRKKISNTFAKELIKNRLDREDFLYEIPNLGIRGKHNIENLMNDNNFLSCIKGNDILNITLDNGWFDINCAKYAKRVVSYSRYCFFKIAREISDYYNVTNCSFINNLKNAGDCNLVIYNRELRVPKCNYLLKNKKVIYDKFNTVVYG